MTQIIHHSKGDRKGMLALIFLISAIGIISSTKVKELQVKPKFDFSKFQASTNIYNTSQSEKKQEFQTYDRSKKSQITEGKEIKKYSANYHSPKAAKSIEILKESKSNNNDNQDIQHQEANLNKRSAYSKPRPYKKYTSKRNFNKKIDVNASDVIDWQALPGIGPYYSKLITNFRDKLGGFSSIEQIGETYQLPDSTFLVIKPYLQMSSLFGKLDINRCSEEELKSHPYINWKQASVIVNYRNEHGAYVYIDELTKILALEKKWLDKVIPYLEISLPEPIVE